MATLDDKLLGEKLHYYCSSSSEDDDGDENDKRNNKGPKFIPESEINDVEKWSGTAKNTGPKGVIQDWQRFKQLEREKTTESEKEKQELLKRLSRTCKTDLEGNDLQKNDKKPVAQASVDEEIERELINDEFFEKYLKESIQNMQKLMANTPKFGKLIELSNQSYINEIDNEKKNVTVIIHIYDGRSECKTMNDCLEELAQEYQFVKFCKVRSLEISLTEKFRKLGCPALLAYKSGELVGNFVCLGEEFGQEFYTSDVESFLIEHGLLPVQDNQKSTIRNKKSKNNDSDTNDDE